MSIRSRKQKIVWSIILALILMVNGIGYSEWESAWEVKAPMSTPRMDSQVVVLDGKIYLIGGNNVDGKPSASVEQYDPETDTWTEKASLNIPRKLFRAEVLNGNIYVDSCEIKPKVIHKQK